MRPEHARPETRYARGHDGSYVAYQVFGRGPRDLVFMPSWLQNVDVMWDEPSLAAYLDRLGSFARVVAFDRRGSGVSDPVPLAALPTVEQWMDDATAAMDAAGIERAALLGDTEGGPLAALLAATHPERVTALVLANTFARWRRADDYPIGMPEATVAKLVERYEQHWGVTAEILDLTAPSTAHDPRFRAWFTRYQRLSMSRGTATAQYRWVTEIDVRGVLPTIRVPTLVLQRSRGRHHRAAFGRYLAEHIPDARYVEVPGVDTFPFHAGDFGPLLDEVEEFLTGTRSPPVFDRQLATILFTDIVGSTEMAAARGDAAWRAVVARHDEIVRAHLERYRGREIAHTGDGVLAVFDGPARAVTCAVRLVEALGEVGLRVRAGLHTGEVERANGDVRGLAVHIAARVMDAAADGGIVASRTVRDLVVGSGVEFTEHGVHELRGVPGEWPLYEAVSAP
ncbi:MAG: adenylate/guanylate cyclase domain-containing protein [Thermoleophilia bacterium]|nr:adenylate/guanylate cyclase domain-containing protein [Thermoleophilia bacterium]